MPIAFLDGRFIVQDSSQMSNSARAIFAQHDVWQYYKFSDATKQNAADYEVAIWQGNPQLPVLPADVVYISADRLSHATSLSKRAESEEFLI